MKYLLDTHTIIWLLDENYELSKDATNILEDISNECFASNVSLFEIAIKTNLKKLEVKSSIKMIETELNSLYIQILEIKSDYLDFYKNLPLFSNHKDPFDRLLISTAAVENLSIISKDTKFNPKISLGFRFRVINTSK